MTTPTPEKPQTTPQRQSSLVTSLSSVTQPVSGAMVGFVPIYAPSFPLPIGYLPVSRAVTNSSITGFAHFFLSNGASMFAPVYEFGAFALTETTAVIPPMFDPNNVMVGSSIVPVYASPLPMNVQPSTLTTTQPIAYLPVYSAANGVSKIRELFGNQGVVSVYSSLNPMLSLNKRGVIPLPSPSLPYASGTTRSLFSSPLSTPPRLPVTAPGDMGSAGGMHFVVTSDGFLKLVTGMPIGSQFTTIFAFANNQPMGIPVYK